VACDTKPFRGRLAILHVVMKAYEALLPLCTTLPTPDRTGTELESHVNHRKLSAVQSRAAEFMCLMECYRDQGEAICQAGDHMLCSGDVEQSTILFKKARTIAEAHGFFSVECLSCHGLGNCCASNGDDDESLEFLRNALAAAPLSEHSCDRLELNLTECVASSLYAMKRYAEAEELMPRLKDLSRSDSLARNSLNIIEVAAFFLRVRLYEQRDELADASMEIRTLGALLENNLVHVLDNAGDFLEMLNALVTLKIFRRSYRPDDPIMKIWEVYEKVGGYVRWGVVLAHVDAIDAHGYRSAAGVNECQ
jgi:tetratricopeptide (TPR) repeat protein